MPRGIESNDLSNAGTNQSDASSAYGTLAPIYSRMATAPTGYTATQMAGFNTANQQSTGGAAASAVGQGALAAARTNNAGGFQAATADAVRQAGVTNSQNALGVQNQNAQLEQKQQQEGLQGLESIYGTSTNAGLGYENAALQAAQATNSDAMGWANLGISGLSSLAGGAGALGYKPFGSGGCWIAEAVYGVDDPRTHTVRAYLNGPYRNTRVGSRVMALYLRFGQRLAPWVKKSRVLKAVFRPLFDRALSNAIAVTVKPNLVGAERKVFVRSLQNMTGQLPLADLQPLLDLSRLGLTHLNGMETSAFGPASLGALLVRETRP